MSFKNSKLEGFLWYSGTKMINLGLWDHFSHFHGNSTWKCWKLPNTYISVWDVENWPPGHRKIQVYWFASIILSKIALIGLQGVKWWIWAFFTLLRFLTLMEWICANTVGRSKNLCYENVKKTWGFALVNKKLEKNWKKTQFW